MKPKRPHILRNPRDLILAVCFVACFVGTIILFGAGVGGGMGAPPPTNGVAPTRTSLAAMASVQNESIPVVIKSTSGDIIGDGTISVFAPKRVQQPQTVLIELDLFFDHQYITPTPFGQRTAFPVTRVTSTPNGNQATVTPRIPIQEESGIDVYQRMGASLLCSAKSFDGCNQNVTGGQIKRIPLNGVVWSWILSPSDGIFGTQDLRIQLWTVQQMNDGSEQPDIILFDYPFQVEVTSPNITASLSNALPVNIGKIIIATIGLLATMLLAFVGARRMAQPGSKRANQDKANPDPMSAKPTVFISYRRSDDWSTARNIRDALQAKKIDAFMDIHDIGEGDFEDVIQRAIAERDFFLLIISPTTFNSEWVVKETDYALAQKKKIVPVLNQFDMYKDPLPPALEVLRRYNAITLTPEFFDGAIERLVQFMNVPTTSGTS